MYTIATFYRFTDLPDQETWRAQLKEQCEKNNILGIIILAHEGLNATVAGPKKGVIAVLEFIRSNQRFKGLTHRECTSENPPFNRLRVIIRPEIVTLGDKSVNPNKTVGEYVPPEQWNDLINDPDLLLIDTRNDYEVQIGTFKNAINPNTQTFGQWDKYVKKNLNPKKQKKVAMFCTGGIRCEKASSIFKSEDINDVHQLKGGILSYLANSKDKKLWEGECFVFDERVTVDKDLNKGSFQQCFACRRPLSEKDLESIHYSAGVSCHKCINEKSEEDRLRYLERHKQIIKKSN